MTQIQLDALGGVAGDMFVAALLDAFPEHKPAVMRAVAAATASSVRCTLVPHNDGVLAGHRFVADPPTGEEAHASVAPRHRDDPGQHHHHGTAHGVGDDAPVPRGAAHRSWSDIKSGLLGSDLDDATRDHAVAIFDVLARAEARVHGIDAAAVVFHEVGAWDSIADIVAAACLISAIDAQLWRVGPLPLGTGRVGTAHGALPVPAPATALLLQGFAVIDDGIGGERVTPTGAAILRHLFDGRPHVPPAGARILGRSGIGFGTKALPGISNCLRVLVFEEVAEATPPFHRELEVIEFEVDDQSAEDLATGLDRLRQQNDVFDVVQMPVFGKKGRMMTHVRVLARVQATPAVIAACFRETTTIGLRHRTVSGAALERRAATVEFGGRTVRVKMVERPGGRTVKAEADDALAEETHAARVALRREAERLALTDFKDP